MKAHSCVLLSTVFLVLCGLRSSPGQENNSRQLANVAERSKSAESIKTEERSESANAQLSNSQTNKITNEEYVIGSEDILSIVVWKEKELSHTIPVRSDGKISIPLVNDIQASGLTTLQLRQAITTRLSQFIEAPEVTVMVTEVRSKRVSILGEIEKPGLYPLLGPKSLLQLISEAGGFRPFAAKKKITVIRNGTVPARRFQINYKDLVDGQYKQGFQLSPGDIVVVP